MLTLQLRREVFDRFADHFQIADDPILNQRVVEEGFASLGRVLFDPGDGIPDVTPEGHGRGPGPQGGRGRWPRRLHPARTIRTPARGRPHVRPQDAGSP